MENSIYEQALTFAYQETEGKQNQPFDFGKFFELHELGEMEQRDLYEYMIDRGYSKFLGGPILTLQYLGIADAEHLLMNSEYKDDIELRKNSRRMVYEKACQLQTDGPPQQFDLWSFGNDLGLTPAQTEQAYFYLCGAGLIEPRGAGFFILTSEGYRNRGLIREF